MSRTRGAWTIGRPFGFPVEVDLSWIAVALLILLGVRFTFTITVVGASAVAAWVAALAATALFLAGVLAHELAHAVVARRRGIEVRRIRLFALGGMTELDPTGAGPRDELAVTVIGPVVSLVLGAAAWWLEGRLGTGLAAAVAGWVAVVNLALGFFNLLPGFPLDGGRALRAAIWLASGDPRLATRIASALGRGVATLVTAFGIATFPVFGLAGLWLAGIGLFLFLAALDARDAVPWSPDLSGLTAGDLMEPTTVVASVLTDPASLADLVAEHGAAVLARPDGRPEAVLVQAPSEGTSRTPRRRPVRGTVERQAPAIAARDLLADEPTDGVVAVLDADGRPAGYVGRESLGPRGG